eukprot:PhM_4_TR230/c0_g2_i1/m.47749
MTTETPRPQQICLLSGGGLRAMASALTFNYVLTHDFPFSNNNIWNQFSDVIGVSGGSWALMSPLLTTDHHSSSPLMFDDFDDFLSELCHVGVVCSLSDKDRQLAESLVSKLIGIAVRHSSKKGSASSASSSSSSTFRQHCSSFASDNNNYNNNHKLTSDPFDFTDDDDESQSPPLLNFNNSIRIPSVLSKAIVNSFGSGILALASRSPLFYWEGRLNSPLILINSTPRRPNLHVALIGAGADTASCSWFCVTLEQQSSTNLRLPITATTTTPATSMTMCLRTPSELAAIAGSAFAFSYTYLLKQVISVSEKQMARQENEDGIAHHLREELAAPVFPNTVANVTIIVREEDQRHQQQKKLVAMRDAGIDCNVALPLVWPLLCCKTNNNNNNNNVAVVWILDNSEGSVNGALLQIAKQKGYLPKGVNGAEEEEEAVEADVKLYWKSTPSQEEEASSTAHSSSVYFLKQTTRFVVFVYIVGLTDNQTMEVSSTEERLQQLVDFR